ncbi:hypothetical protein IFM89_014738 [Coptis chinensis]|uniref:Uncharacterized protein n=1 Tax=Coptis chinensis TaxID=261450 RepID=A0A835MEH1_9MAGN|nr:hypothetical protein IFM89_014738 [Coptis chinensis]
MGKVAPNKCWLEPKMGTDFGVVNTPMVKSQHSEGGDGSGQSEHGDDAIVEKKCVLFDEDGRPVGGKSAEFSSSLGEISRAHASIVFQTKKRILTLRPVTRTVLYVALHTNDNGTCPIEEHCVEVDLIEFCKDTGLQSSNATIRNATIKLIGAVHKFIGPDIKGFLTDVKPALLSALDAEYEKNPFEGTSAAPRKTVKASESTLSMSAGGLDGLPREDISGKITPTFLKNLSSPDWKIRLELFGRS